jgi:hypothetical protein
MGSRAHGLLGSWALGHSGTRALGLSGTWAQGLKVQTFLYFSVSHFRPSSRAQGLKGIKIKGQTQSSKSKPFRCISLWAIFGY